MGAKLKKFLSRIPLLLQINILLAVIVTIIAVGFLSTVRSVGRAHAIADAEEARKEAHQKSVELETELAERKMIEADLRISEEKLQELADKMLC